MKKRQLFTKTAAVGMAVTMSVSLCACSGGALDSEKEKKAEGMDYQVTEENEVENVTMNNQPESSYWFPEQLLEWEPEKDEDLEYNVSHEPLAKRVDKEKLETVNKTQNKDTRVMAISIMNSSTSGNAPHGLNSVDCNAFTYWQYVDELVYWGGSSGEGLIVPPSPDVTDLGHKNGVPVIGTVFFPQDVAGGKMEWLDTFLTEKEDGSFPVADKLIQVAETYGFDGWFINQETEGAEERPLNREDAVRMQKFIQYFKKQAPEMRLVYYDSMTSEGKMDWQNALTDKNAMFMMDEEGNAVADEMFLNFWWSEEELAEKDLLKASREKAEELGISPYDLYAGIDVQAEGYLTPARWDLFESGENTTNTSLGLYCPSWAYYSAATPDEFRQKEDALWVNGEGNPSAEIEYSSEEQWRGISAYAVEKSALTALPFVTNFSTGNGYSFFREGEQISKMDWNNRSVGDVLPTYRWMIENEGENSLKADFDVSQAWYGGNSLKLYGNMEKDKASRIQMYSADLPVEENTVFTTVAKSGTESELNAVLTFDDGSEEILKGDKKISDNWTEVTYDLSQFAGKKIRTISYDITAMEADDQYALNLGNISIYNEGDFQEAGEVTDVTVDDYEFDEDAMYTGVRLSWESSTDAPYYEIYRVNKDKTCSFLGLSNTKCFYVNTLTRTDDTNKSEFKVVPVNEQGQQGKGASVKMDWPDNSLPKAGLTASQTLVGTGSTVTFTSACSENTEEVSWSVPGSDKETAEGESVTAVFEKEGTYEVSATAKNESGEDTRSISVVVTSDLQKDEELTLISQGKDTQATSFTNENEAPQFAVDGDTAKKWCATGTAPHEIIIDLGQEMAVSQVAIAHAEAGGEGADMNTKSYEISVSTDNTEYTPVAKNTKNAEANTVDAFTPVNARYVKVSVVKPTQGSDTAARIYEIQVYGTETKLK